MFVGHTPAERSAPVGEGQLPKRPWSPVQVSEHACDLRGGTAASAVSLKGRLSRFGRRGEVLGASVAVDRGGRERAATEEERLKTCPVAVGRREKSLVRGCVRGDQRLKRPKVRVYEDIGACVRARVCVIYRRLESLQSLFQPLQGT